MRYPSFLSPGGAIGFVAPSFGCTPPFDGSFNAALEQFYLLGHPTIEGATCRRSDGLGISAPPELCGQDLTEAYCANDNQALISCGGGEMMCRILDYVDFDRIRAAMPKWYMGLSDNTNFTFLLTTLCDVASIYGPCAGAFGMHPWHPAVQDAYDALTGHNLTFKSYSGYQSAMFCENPDPRAPYDISAPLQLHTVPNMPLRFTGRLLGGCLDVLVNLSGTCYDRVSDFTERYREDGIIWFLEACDLNVWGICRALWQLEHSGWFQHGRGFIIGRPLCNGQQEGAMNQYRAVTEILEKYGVPIIMDADLGHLPPSMPLICGSKATVTCAHNHMAVEMSLS